MRPPVVERAIALALEELAPARRHETGTRQADQIAQLEIECERLVTAIAQGGELDVLVRRLHDREDRLRGLRSARDVAPTPPMAPVDHATLRTGLRGLVREWRRLLVLDVASGRTVLRALLEGPIRFTPLVDDGRKRYAFEGAIALDRLVEGVVNLPWCGTSPTGFEPVFQP